MGWMLMYWPITWSENELDHVENVRRLSFKTNSALPCSHKAADQNVYHRNYLSQPEEAQDNNPSSKDRRCPGLGIVLRSQQQLHDQKCNTGRWLGRTSRRSKHTCYPCSTRRIPGCRCRRCHNSWSASQRRRYPRRSHSIGACVQL